MKKYLIFLLFFSLLSYSQDCKIKVEKDAFNKTIKSKIIQNNLSAGLSCDFYKLEKSDEKIYYLSFFLNNITSQCLTDKSKVYFLFEEDEVLEFPYRGKIDCGGTSIIIRLDEEQINLLKITVNNLNNIVIIILTTLLTAFLFDYFENSKMNENTQKFYGIDKYKKEVSTIQSELAENKADTILLKKLTLTEEKLTKATASFNLVHPLIENFDNTSANYIAKVAKDSGWLKNVAVSKCHRINATCQLVCTEHTC